MRAGARTASGTPRRGVADDIRNHPVREFARPRRLALWRLSTGLAVLLVASLAVVWQEAEVRRYGYAIDRLQRERADVDRANERLRLELEMLRSPARVEAFALTRLQLQQPHPEDLIVLGGLRVTTSGPGTFNGQM